MDKDGYGYSRLFPTVEPLSEEKSVAFLLGTDRHLDEGTEKQEKRVGIIPFQAGALIEWLKNAGIILHLFVVAGAGEGAGFSDADYEKIGAKIIDESDLPNLSLVPGVVHSLKESFVYESTIPGPFIRIGACHTGQIDPDGGTAALLQNRKTYGIFDGSCIGGHSYKITGGFPIPIRSSMSVFAGKIGADQVANHIEAGSKVIISAGGAAGISAVRQLLSRQQNESYRILLIEKDSKRCLHLREIFAENPNVTVREGTTVEVEDILGSSGIIFAASVPGMSAPEVVTLETLKLMNPNSIIVDIACDEGVGIVGFRDINKLSTDNIAAARDACANLGIIYLADAHMPREYPGEASESHGCAILPYLAVLLYLSGNLGTEGAVKFIEDIQPDETSLFGALVSDLKDGLPFSGFDPVVIHEGIVKDVPRAEELCKKLNIDYEVRCFCEV